MILIFPYARALRNGLNNPKNYPWWPELIEKLQKNIEIPGPIIQLGTKEEKQLVSNFYTDVPLEKLGELVDTCDTWISVDSFGQHFCWDRGKPGIVLWGQSDPLIFGHPENINLLKDRKYLRDKQFWLWEQCNYKEEAFVDTDTVVEAVLKSINR